MCNFTKDRPPLRVFSLEFYQFFRLAILEGACQQLLLKKKLTPINVISTFLREFQLYKSVSNSSPCSCCLHKTKLIIKTSNRLLVLYRIFTKFTGKHLQWTLQAKARALKKDSRFFPENFTKLSR